MFSIFVENPSPYIIGSAYISLENIGYLEEIKENLKLVNYTGELGEL